MKKLIASFSIILLFSISTVWGQSRCRQVRFQPGQTSTVLKGRVRYRKLFCYTLRARANQRMSVHVSSRRKDVRFTVEPNDIRSKLPSKFTLDHAGGR